MTLEELQLCIHLSERGALWEGKRWQAICVAVVDTHLMAVDDGIYLHSSL